MMQKKIKMTLQILILKNVCFNVNKMFKWKSLI